VKWKKGMDCRELQTRASKGIEVANFDNQNLIHGHRRYREDIVMPLKLHGVGGQNDWGEVIEKVAKGK
jgi:hypothetical protein